MNTISVSENEDVTDDEEIFAMNFSDDDEDFPASTQIKTEEYLDNTSPSPIQTSDTFDHDQAVNIENHGMCFEDTKENIFNELDLVAPAPEDEYILGADATPAVLAIARNICIEDDESTTAYNQPASDIIILESDSNDDSNSSHVVNVTQNVLLSSTKDKINDSLHAENLSHNISSIIITNVTSIVEGSENISSQLIEEGRTDENLKSSESNFDNEILQGCLAHKNPSESKLIFKCERCPFSAKTRFSLSRHITLHTNIHTSIESNQKSTGENNVLSQTNICSQPEGLEIPKTTLFKCDICSFVSKIRFALQRHILTHTNITKKSKCLADQKKTESSKVGVFKCKYCSFVAKTNSGLVTHVRFIHNSKSKVKCLSCHKRIRKQSIREHKLTCIKANKHRSKRSATTAIKIVEATSKITNITFSKKIKRTENNFDKNITATLSSTLPKYKCEYCSYRDNFDSAVRKHELVHTKYNQPIYRCHECNYKSTRSALIRHVGSTHRGDKLSLSGKKIDKDWLKIELGESDKKEEGSKVTVKSVLNKIKNVTETGKSKLTKPSSLDQSQSKVISTYSCPYCSFSTKFSDSIRRHKLLHTEYNRPIYNCKNCSYKSTKGALIKHACSTNGVKSLVSTKKSVKISNGILKTISGKGVKKGPDPETSAHSILHETETHQINQFNGSPKLTKDQLNQADNTDDLSEFQCTYCSHVSKNKRNAYIHLLMHTKSNKTYRCKQCDYMSTKTALTRHINTVHRGKKLKNVMKNNKSAGENIPLSKQTENNLKYEKKHIVPSSSIINSGDNLRDGLSIKKDVTTLKGRLSTFNNNKELKGLNKDDSRSTDKRRNTISYIDSNAIVYVCEICGYETNRKETLIIHKRAHGSTTLTADENKITCSGSNYTTENKKQFINNVVSKPEKNIPQNNIKSFNDKQEREFILLKGDKRQCSVCKRICLSHAGFLKHRCINLSEFSKLVKRKGDNFTCKECLFSSVNWYRVKAHLMVHKTFEEAAVHKCLMCDFRTKYKTSLASHMLRVHDKLDSQNLLKYNCDLCNYKTNHHLLIGRHKISCHKEPIICDICSFTTIFPTVMVNHKKFIHKLQEIEDKKVDKTSDEVRYKCDNCDFQTNYKHNLQNHKVVHININEFRVYKNKTYNVKIKKQGSKKANDEKETSNRNFKEQATQPNLDTLGNHHSLTKKKGKLYKCNVCSYSTAILQSFTRHKTIHDTSTIYNCDYCAYNSHAKVNVYNHKLKYHPKNSKNTTSSLKLNNRNNSQVLEKSTKSGIQFSCKYCKHKTKFRIKLKKHVEKMHSKNLKANKEKLFKCSSCSYSSENKYNLKRHVQNLHLVPAVKDTQPFYKAYKQNLDRHVEKIHDESKELSKDLKVSKKSIFKCTSCFYSSKYKHNLDKHFNMCHVAK